MVREIGMRWALFAGGWSTWLAWFSSVEFYQAATFARHPAASLAWMLVLAAAMTAYITGLRAWSARHAPAPPAPAQ
jgi:ferrous iron transport protein B